jgi:hypothetical protein
VHDILARLAVFFRAPQLTRTRILCAYLIAGTTDVLQLMLGPIGWAFADEILDVVAMIAISRAIGFHVLFLPTFALELLPLTDMLPSWTGAVGIVVALRRRLGQPPPGGAPTPSAW